MIIKNPNFTHIYQAVWTVGSLFSHKLTGFLSS